MPRPGRLATTKSCWDSPAWHCNAAPRASACPSPAHWAPPAAPWHVPPPCRNPYALRSANVCPCAMRGDPSVRSGTCREQREEKRKIHQFCLSHYMPSQADSPQVYGVTQTLHLLRTDKVPQLAGGACRCGTARWLSRRRRLPFPCGLLASTRIRWVARQLFGKNALAYEGAMQWRHIPHIVGNDKHAHHCAHGIQQRGLHSARTWHKVTLAGQTYLAL